MFRTALAALTALSVGLSAASADELKGTLKRVNKSGNSLTLTVNGKDRVLSVSKDASFVTATTEKGKKGKTTEKLTPIDGGLGALKEGSAVTVLTEKAGEKDTVTSVKVSNGAAQPAKKKAKKPKKTSQLLRPISADTPAGDDLAAGKKGKSADKAKGKKGKKAAKKASKKGKKKGKKK